MPTTTTQRADELRELTQRVARIKSQPRPGLVAALCLVVVKLGKLFEAIRQTGKLPAEMDSQPRQLIYYVVSYGDDAEAYISIHAGYKQPDRTGLALAFAELVMAIDTLAEKFEISILRAVEEETRTP